MAVVQARNGYPALCCACAVTTRSKVCTKCHEEKPLDAFSPLERGRLGRHAHCRACINRMACAARARLGVTPRSAPYRHLIEAEHAEEPFEPPAIPDEERDRLECARFVNEMHALLREGVPWREAWSRANEDTDDLGPEEDPVGMSAALPRSAQDIEVAPSSADVRGALSDSGVSPRIPPSATAAPASADSETRLSPERGAGNSYAVEEA